MWLRLSEVHIVDSPFLAIPPAGSCLVRRRRVQRSRRRALRALRRSGRYVTAIGLASFKQYIYIHMYIYIYI